MFEPTRHDWDTFGQIAMTTEPSTIQTEALDLIDEYLVKVEAGEIHQRIINLPPQEGKSKRVSTIGPLWFLSRDPNRRTAIMSDAQDLDLGFKNVDELDADFPDPRSWFDGLTEDAQRTIMGLGRLKKLQDGGIVWDDLTRKIESPDGITQCTSSP